MDHEQVVNKKASEVLPPDIFADIIRTLNTLVQTGEMQTSLMYWPLTNNWLYSEFSLSAKEGYVDRYLVDQTELVLLKEKAEKSNKEIIDANKKSELILKNANSLLAYVDTDYKVLWSNADYAFNGRAKGLCLVGNKHLCSMLEVGYACERCPIKATITDEKVTSREFTREGIGEFRVTATPLDGADIEKEGVILKIDDITEYKQLIRDLERSSKRAEEADKLKSAFLANMSHEIRTPLNAIIGFSELLQTTDCKEEREEYMNIINTNNELLLRLIGDILDLSKIESGSVELLPERFDFSTFFEETKAMLGPRFQKSEVELRSINPLAKCVVELDKSRCLQILTNYLTNAFKYTKQGTVTMSYCYTDNCIIIKVEDTGIGIPEEKIGRLFDRFEKLDDFAQGTGLGLSICKALADSIGATVGAESAEGVGSTFWVSIPCKADIETTENSYDVEVSPNGVNKRASKQHTMQLRNILIAEDNDSNYLLAKAILREYNVTRATNGAEAVRLAKQYKYDAILMDMKMPMMGGLEATKKIRTFDPHTIIVAVTANAYDSDKQNALEAGCNSFITKPIRRDNLLSSIMEQIERDSVSAC